MDSGPKEAWERHRPLPGALWPGGGVAWGGLGDRGNARGDRACCGVGKVGDWCGASTCPQGEGGRRV